MNYGKLQLNVIIKYISWTKYYTDYLMAFYSNEVGIMVIHTYMVYTHVMDIHGLRVLWN